MKERGLARKKERPHSQPVKGDVKLGQVQFFESVKIMVLATHSREMMSCCCNKAVVINRARFSKWVAQLMRWTFMTVSTRDYAPALCNNRMPLLIGRRYLLKCVVSL